VGPVSRRKSRDNRPSSIVFTFFLKIRLNLNENTDVVQCKDLTNREKPELMKLLPNFLAKVSANVSVVMASLVWFSRLDVLELLERANALSDLSN